MAEEVNFKVPELKEDEIYRGALERARKEFPALVKRLSNTISQEEKERLINPHSEEFNPNFKYPKLFDLDSNAIAEKRRTIEENLKTVDEIEATGYQPTIGDEFDKEKTHLGLRNLLLIDLAQRIVTNDGQEQIEASSRFRALDVEMQGEVDTYLYQGILNHLHRIIDAAPEAAHEAIRIAKELKQMLPAQKGDNGLVGLPQDTFEGYKQAYNLIFGEWLNKIIPQKNGDFTPQEIAEVFTNALESMSFDKLGWRIVLEDVPSLKISMEDKVVTIPIHRKPLSKEELRARVVHEIGHITRGWNGSSISHSAEHGLPDYLNAEEGLMAYGEQFITGQQTGNVTYTERYLGVGLMVGTDGGEAKDFKAVFAAMWRARALMDNFEKIQDGEDITVDDIKSAREDSLMNARRLFRGSTGEIAGVGWTKDKAYYEGMAQLTELLTQFADKLGIENIHWLFAAKFDPTNNLHNRYVGMPPLDRIAYSGN